MLNGLQIKLLKSWVMDWLYHIFRVQLKLVLPCLHGVDNLQFSDWGLWIGWDSLRTVIISSILNLLPIILIKSLNCCSSIFRFLVSSFSLPWKIQFQKVWSLIPIFNDPAPWGGYGYFLEQITTCLLVIILSKVIIGLYLFSRFFLLLLGLVPIFSGVDNLLCFNRLFSISANTPPPAVKTSSYCTEKKNIIIVLLIHYIDTGRSALEQATGRN